MYVFEGALPVGKHGNCKIKEEHQRQFRQVINQPERRDLSVLQPAVLYRMFVNIGENIGKWKIKVARRTFYDFINRIEFNVVRPLLVPWVTAAHIAARERWAKQLMNMDQDDLLLFTATAIYIDGTIFADKFPEGYGLDKMKVVVDAHEPIEALYRQFPVLTTNLQLYQGINFFGATGPFFINDYHKDRKGTPNGDMIKIFLKKEVVPLAKKIRQALNLPPNEPIPIIWDHAKVHKSNVVKAALKELNLYDAELPARCPELNVIENLWAIYKRTLMEETHSKQFQKEVVKQVKKTEQTTVRNLCASFVARVEEMVRHKGKPFHYKGNQARTDEVLRLI